MMNHEKNNPRNDQCCEDCTVECNNNFKKVLDLKKSGLVVYIHQRNNKIIVPAVEKHDAVIFFNTTGKYIRKPALISELGQYKGKCFQCRTIIKRVSDFLAEIKFIKGNETIGVCDFCKRRNVSNCKRCEYIVSKFMTTKMNSEEAKLQYYKAWVCEVMTFLKSLLEESLYERTITYYKRESVEELIRLLGELKPPLSIQEHDIYKFPFLEELIDYDNLSESKELLDKLLIKFKTLREMTLKNTSSRSLPSIDANFKVENIHYNSSCSDLSIKEKEKLSAEKDKGNLAMDSDKTTKLNKLGRLKGEKNEKASGKKTSKPYSNVLEDITNLETRKRKFLKVKSEAIEFENRRWSEKKLRNKVSYKDSNVLKKKEKGKGKNENKVNRTNRAGQEFQKINKKFKKSVRTVGTFTREPLMLDLPVLKLRDLVETSSTSSTTIECGGKQFVPNVMIKGHNIVPLDLHCSQNKKVNDGVVPLLYHIEKNISSHSCQSSFINESTAVSNKLPTIASNKKQHKSKTHTCSDNKGVIKFQLSDPDCITKGWTLLPSLKIKRRMHVYKMNPINREKNWFERHKNNTILYEDSEERLAYIDEEGFGKLFYKNGRTALEYYKAKEPYAGHRYVIYSDGELENGMPKPVTVLGVFDGIGNGVIYDDNGCERLKYNQSEGIIIDKSIDSPCKWKWHTLNDPPVLQTVFVDTQCKKSDKSFDKESINERKHDAKHDDIMLKIELENILREKGHKLLQKFIPIEIKSKAVKINHQFSLRIFKQSNIYLMFREGRTSVKINLGLMLVSNEIVNTEVAEVSEVYTSYDCFPSRSESIENIQQILQSTRNLRRK